MTREVLIDKLLQYGFVKDCKFYDVVEWFDLEVIEMKWSTNQTIKDAFIKVPISEKEQKLTLSLYFKEVNSKTGYKHEMFEPGNYSNLLTRVIELLEHGKRAIN